MLLEAGFTDLRPIYQVKNPLSRFFLIIQWLQPAFQDSRTASSINNCAVVVPRHAFLRKCPAI
jgi:hypothetical protein